MNTNTFSWCIKKMWLNLYFFASGKGLLLKKDLALLILKSCVRSMISNMILIAGFKFEFISCDKNHTRQLYTPGDFCNVNRQQAMNLIM